MLLAFLKMLKTCFGVPSLISGTFGKTLPATKLGLAARCLSAHQTATALRPFYFIVHPDLFGKHPKERAVNEESLKHLRQYLEKLQAQKTQAIQPLDLLFYIRSQDPASKARVYPPQNEFQEVKITLKPTTVKETVRTILQSCKLSVDYIESVKPVLRPAPFPRPIKWDPTFYSYYGIPNPDEGEKSSQSISLGGWLKQNVPLARRKQDHIRPIREEVERLTSILLSETGLKGVTWSSAWGQTQYRASLRGLLRICRQNNIDINGKYISFGNKTGVCCHGNILLRHNDVADNWLWILQSVSKYKSLMFRIPTVELYLSTILGGTHIIRRQQNPPLADVYFRELRRFLRTVHAYLTQHPNSLEVDLRDVALMVECMTGPMLVGTYGEIHVPSNSPGFLTIEYLNKIAPIAKQRQGNFRKTLQLKESLVSLCINRLRLKSMRCGDNITSDQLIVCCRHILNNYERFPVTLDGCRLQVNMFYSVMSDGEICIPWNYAGDTYSDS